MDSLQVNYTCKVVMQLKNPNHHLPYKRKGGLCNKDQFQLLFTTRIDLDFKIHKSRFCTFKLYNTSISSN